MNHFGQYVAAMMLVAALVCRADAAPADPESVVTAFHRALHEGDSQMALSMLSDNVQIYEQGFVERSKAEYQSHHLASDIEFSKAVTSDVTARSAFVLGEIAYVTRESRTIGTFQGKAIDSLGLETMVLRLSGGAWQIVHIHWSSRKAK